MSGVCACSSRAISVLFVDDDADTLFAYQLLATEEGWNVELARDGHQAIALANVLPPDVVVLDVGLRSADGFNGFEVAFALRASPRTHAIPIVIVSGWNSARDVAAMAASGCDGHLVKPVVVDELFGLLATLAARGQERVADAMEDARAASLEVG